MTMYSLSKDDQSKRRTMLVKDYDCVRINVGGTIFTTAKSTLVSNSIYFDTKFNRWYDREQEELLFVDQDPEPFRVLLSYMRLGHIKRKDISEAVLLQAEYFGMIKLLNVVKRIAYEHIEAGNLVRSMSEEEMVDAFDEKYGGTLGALSSGILPYQIKKPQEKEKEYAQLVVWDLAVKDSDHHQTTLVSVKLPEYCRPSQGTNDNRAFVANCGTFLDAINTLHEHGFVTLDPNYHCVGDGINDLCDRNYWFWRYKKKTVQKDQYYTSSPVLFEPENEDRVPIRKQFAAIINDSPGQFYLRAQVGESSDLEADRNDYFFLAIPAETRTNLSTSVTVVEKCKDVISMINWLQKNGYRKQEHDLGKIFVHLYAKENEDSLGSALFGMRLYSKELKIED